MPQSKFPLLEALTHQPRTGKQKKKNMKNIGNRRQLVTIIVRAKCELYLPNRNI